MYKIYLGNTLIFDDDEISKTNFLTEPTLEMEVGKAGTFTFTIYPEHPNYDDFTKLTSRVWVEQNGERIFHGRVLSSEDNFLKARKITVEGTLAFLNDTIVRPYDFSTFTFQHKSPTELLSYFISEHNSQVELGRQIILGTVNVTLPEGNYLSPVNTSYDSTMQNINKYLLDECGGYLLIRYNNGVAYLDYLSDFTIQSNQTIEFGKNLVDVTQIVEADDVATAIIPLGNDEEIEEEYIDPETHEVLTRTIRKPITIVGVIDPDTHEEITVDYIRNESLISQYGLIFRSVSFDCDLRIDLYTQAKAYVESLSMLTKSVELTALDLSRVDVSLDSFRIGTKIHMKSEYHGIDDYIPVTKISLDILHPEDSKLTLGNSNSSFTEGNTKQTNKTRKTIERITKNLESEIDNIDVSIPMVKLSWNGVNNVAKIEQTNEDKFVEVPISNGKIFADCSDSVSYPNSKTVTNTPSDSMGYFALQPVVSETETVYHPFFAMRVITQQGIKWYDINDSSLLTERTDIFIIGTFDMKNNLVNEWGVARTTSEADLVAFMTYFATVKDVSDSTLQAYATATGIDSIFKKVAILEALVKNLFAVNLNVGAGGNFSVIAKTYDEDGTFNPVFEIKYGNNSLFRVDAQTGYIYFGTGFYYKYSDAKIHSNNDMVIIDSEGILEVFNAVINNATIVGANITQGFFNGSIDCPSFSSLPASTETHSANLGSGSETQWRALRSLWNNYVSGSGWVKCTLQYGSNTINTYVQYFSSGRQFGYTFKNGDEIRVRVPEFGSTSYYSSFGNYNASITITLGGDKFVFKDIPTSSSGLQTGQVWCDTGNNNVLKIVR